MKCIKTTNKSLRRVNGKDNSAFSKDNDFQLGYYQNIMNYALKMSGMLLDSAWSKNLRM